MDQTNIALNEALCALVGYKKFTGHDPKTCDLFGGYYTCQCAVNKGEFEQLPNLLDYNTLREIEDKLEVATKHYKKWLTILEKHTTNTHFATKAQRAQTLIELFKQ